MNEDLERDVEQTLARLATRAVPESSEVPAPPWQQPPRRHLDVRRFGRATPWLVAAVLLVIAGLGVGAAVTFDASTPDRGPVGTDGPNPGPVVSPDASDTPTTPTSTPTHPTLSRGTNGTAPDETETTASSATTSGAADSQIAVYANCNDPSSDPPAVRPTSIALACADGGANLLGLQWSSWTATGAVGTGTFEYRTCDPDCVTGSQVHRREGVTVTLSGPQQASDGLMLWTHLELSPDPFGGQGYQLQTQP